MNQATHFSPSPMILQLGPLITMDSEQFLRFCGLNRDWRLERNERGEVEVMVPTGGETSSRNSEINFALQSWARRDQTGIVFDSSGGFCLPNSAIRSPDVSWVLKTRLKGLDNEEKKKFLPLCPDFVIELRSPTDRLSILQAKMDEYQTNDCRLGWLIDPQEMAVTVYRPGTEPERLNHPMSLSGDPVLPGFLCVAPLIPGDQYRVMLLRMNSVAAKRSRVAAR